MKEIITNKGILKYRMPNILEAYDILDASEIGENNSMLKLKRNVIVAMKPLIDFSLIENASSYDDLINDSENMMIPLSEIAEDIIVKTFDVFKKKELITDAISVLTQRLSIEELIELVGEKDKAEAIMETVKSIISYSQFKRVIDLGVTVNLNEIPFERAMLFSWIKDSIDERKIRV